MRPRRIWEQQQMKTAVPTIACSAKYGRPAAPRAAPTCPGKPLAAGRAVSDHSHGEVAASEAVASCPSVKVTADCVSCDCPGAAAAVAPPCSPVAVQLLEAVIQKGHAAQISKGRNM